MDSGEEDIIGALGERHDTKLSLNLVAALGMTWDSIKVIKVDEALAGAAENYLCSFIPLVLDTVYTLFCQGRAFESVLLTFLTIVIKYRTRSNFKEEGFLSAYKEAMLFLSTVGGTCGMTCLYLSGPGNK